LIVLLNPAQLRFYRENGFLLLENYFSPAELDILTAELPTLFSEDTPRRILERSGAVRTVFAPHTTNAVYRCLMRLRRMVEPARQLLGSDVYLHQFKINAKVALDGDWWEWHQDFLYWNKEDGMAAPRVVTAALFLQDVDEFNGPMLIVPGSHLEGVIETQPPSAARANGHPNSDAWMPTLTADLKYKIAREQLEAVLNRRSIMSVKGRAGLAVFFDGNLLHASTHNLSTHDRVSAFVTYNSVENTLHRIANPRPQFLASHDFTRITPVEDSALLELGRNSHEA
jgi:ectoine hydroxylase